MAERRMRIASPGMATTLYGKRIEAGPLFRRRSSLVTWRTWRGRVIDDDKVPRRLRSCAEVRRNAGADGGCPRRGTPTATRGGWCGPSRGCRTCPVVGYSPRPQCGRSDFLGTSSGSCHLGSYPDGEVWCRRRLGGAYRTRHRTHAADRLGPCAVHISGDRRPGIPCGRGCHQ
jgi:hypothetical protein